MVEVIDDVNLSTTYKIIEGDKVKKNKSFKATVKAIPKDNGSVVYWTLEYEKLNKDIPEPHSILRFAVDLIKDIDARLVTEP
ncbi:hypothetical protein JCGZ_04714 [Jatropha curcas]|uniref:Bet v I/Major latex protein domain-containing protein n=1 Tax=Jatropha curcas TaxID=180498 RepID=A0A067KPC6_JATCU|nr:hypothetical protein JCGZ_04714 [Jatropha curcas]